MSPGFSGIEEVSSLTPGDPWEDGCRFHSGCMSEPVPALLLADYGVLEGT